MFGLLCSRSVSQPSLKFQLMLDILCIAEPFVTKPSRVIHHYKPEYHVWKMGFYLLGQDHSNWIWVHIIKSWLYVLNCWFFGDRLSLTVHVHKLECLVKRLLCVFNVKVTMKVLSFSECLPGQYLWSVKLCMVGAARVSFRNMILLCSRSKPQSFLLDL